MKFYYQGRKRDILTQTVTTVVDKIIFSFTSKEIKLGKTTYSR